MNSESAPLKKNMHRRYLVVAGELSGDILAADLVKALRLREPEACFRGIGGSRMRAEGVKTAFDVAQMAVVGFTEIVASFRVIARAYRWVGKQLPHIDAVILVDYPGFNLRVARRAKQAGLAVFYYVSPTIWAWHASRLKQIQAYVDHMFVILPFELPLYQKAGVPATLLRHPLLNKQPDPRDRTACCVQYGLDPDRPVLLLMPGSRKQELQRLWGLMKASFLALKQRVPGLQCVCARAPHVPLHYFQGAHEAGIRCFEEDHAACFLMADSALCASGTATLELALEGVPMVVVYKVGAVTYPIARCCIKTPHIALCNILLGERVVPELVQHEASVHAVVPELVRSLTCLKSRSKIKQSFAALQASFAEAEPVSVAADVVAEPVYDVCV